MNNKWYKILHPMIWLIIGMTSLTALHLYANPINFYTLFADSREYKTTDGKFACWWVRDVMDTPDFQDKSEFIKELFMLEEKYCVDMPRP